MRHSRTIALLLTTMVAASAASAQATRVPIVRLDLVPARILPGVPVNLLITMTNPGERQLEIPNWARMHVAPPSGEPFIATDDESSSPTDSFGLVSEFGPSVTLGPGETKSWVLPVHPLLAEPVAFMDERLSWPGRYRLSLETMTGSAQPMETVQSNEAVLTILQPEGLDLIVWKHMLEMSSGRGWSGHYWMESVIDLAKYIHDNAPDSGYYPYVADFKLPGQTAAELREGIEHAIALRPEGPVADQLKGALAGWYLERGEEAFAEGDLERAVELYAEARRRAVESNRTTAYPWLREFGERWLIDECDSELSLRGRFSVHLKAMATFTNPVTPFVECVDPGFTNSDPYIVWFGYSNPNAGQRFVERGKGNDLTPSAPNQQPPRVFRPGRQKYGFSVTTHADRVTWIVDGTKVTASRDTQPRCTYPKAAELGLRPVVDCIRKDGEQVIVSFGYESPSTVAVRVAGGTDNQLTGTKGEPPTIFEPGRHYNVLQVKAKKGEAVSWRLAGRTADSAAPSASVVCAADRE